MALSAPLAERRLQQFETRFGPRLIAFAAAAALPVVLDTRLVHLIRINFFLDTADPLPWTAESDLLFSPLCTDLGDGLFEIEPTTRALLLTRLASCGGAGRIRDLASLLWTHLHHRPAPWAHEPGLERAQELTALHFLDPDECERWLSHAESAIDGEAHVERPWFVAVRHKLEPWRAVQAQRREAIEWRSSVAALTRDCDALLLVGRGLALGPPLREEVETALEEISSARSRLERLGEESDEQLLDLQRTIETLTVTVSLPRFVVTYAALQTLGFAQQMKAARAAGWGTASSSGLLISGPRSSGHEWLATRLVEQHGDSDGPVFFVEDGQDAHVSGVISAELLPPLTDVAPGEINEWLERVRPLLARPKAVHLDHLTGLDVSLMFNFAIVQLGLDHDQVAQRLQRAKRDIIDSAEWSSPRSHVVDVAVLSNVAREVEALLALGHNWSRAPSYFGSGVRSFISTTQRGLRVYLAGCGQGELDPQAAQICFRECRPRLVLLVDLLSGSSERGIVPGDVIIADEIIVPGRVNDGNELAIQSGDRALVSAITAFAADGWTPETRATRPDHTRKTRVHVGQVASADTRSRKTVGIDLGGMGQAIAAVENEQRPRMVLVGGVSDLADHRKDDSWQAYAADAAASLVWSFIEHLDPTLSLLAPTIEPSAQPRNVFLEVLGDASDLSSLLGLALATLEQLTGTDYNQIFLLGSDGGARDLLAVADAIAPGKARYRAAGPGGLLGRALQGHAVNAHHVDRERDYIVSVKETRSELVVPIATSEGEVIGVMNSESEQEAHFGKTIEARVVALASALGEKLNGTSSWNDGRTGPLPWLRRLPGGGIEPDIERLSRLRHGRFDRGSALRKAFDDPAIRVIVVTGRTGSARETSVAAWLASADPRYQGSKAVFGWSFGPDAGPEWPAFRDAATSFFGAKNNAADPSTDLVQAIGERNGLVVMTGLARHSHDGSLWLDAVALLREIAVSHSARCIVTVDVLPGELRGLQSVAWLDLTALDTRLASTLAEFPSIGTELWVEQLAAFGDDTLVEASIAATEIVEGFSSDLLRLWSAFPRKKVAYAAVGAAYDRLLASLTASAASAASDRDSASVLQVARRTLATAMLLHGPRRVHEALSMRLIQGLNIPAAPDDTSTKTIVDRLARHAAEYERLRRDVSSGQSRTEEMDRLFRSAGTSTRGGVSERMITDLYAGAGDGARVVALACCVENPTAAPIEIIVDGIASSRSAFEQWAAISAAKAVIDSLRPSVSEPCAAAISTQLASPQSWLGQEANLSRGKLARTVLTTFATKLGFTETVRREVLHEWLETRVANRPGQGLVAAVFGSDTSDAHVGTYEALGALLASHGWRLVIGRGRNVGAAVVAGFRRVEAAPGNVTVYESRARADMLADAACAIVVAGAEGTALECAMAADAGIPIVPIRHTGGTAAQIALRARRRLIELEVPAEILDLLDVLSPSADSLDAVVRTAAIAAKRTLDALEGKLVRTGLRTRRADVPAKGGASHIEADGLPSQRESSNRDAQSSGYSRKASLHSEPPSRRRPMKHTILFLAANPLGTDRLALDEECAAIERELGMTSGRDPFDFRSKWAVSVDELMRHLNELQPAILHFSGQGSITTAGSILYFSGHGSTSTVGSSHAQGDPHRDIETPRGAGIFLQNEGSSQYVSERALAKVIESVSPSTRVVVLNACFSAPVAESLRHVVDCVVGMDGAIADTAARSFAVAFYRALGNRRSVGNAVAQAVATLAANRLPGHLPVCRTRDGLSADQIFLPTLGQHRPDPAEPHANRAGASSALAFQPSRLSASTAPPQKVDIGILTIRDDEFRAVLAAFPSKAGSRNGPKREYTLRHADAGNGEQYTVAVLRSVEQGKGEAQDAARDLIEDLDPRLVLVVGIASGLPSNDVTLGDVVVSTRIQDFTVGARRSGQKRTYAATGGPLAEALSSFVTNLPAREDELGDWTADLPPRPPVTWTRERQLYGPPEWQRELWAKLEQHHGEGSTPRAPVYAAGPIASSDRLIEEPESLIRWLQTTRNLLAVEMESGGVFRAAQERCPMLAIRGISDIVGLSRAEAWTRFACASAAAFTCAFLRTQPVPVGGSLPGYRFKEAFGVMWDGRHFDADLAGASEVTIAFVDMNGMKQINEAEGYAAGDDAIRRYLGVVQEVVGAAGTCYRGGGDEVMISFPDTTAVAAREIMLSALARLGGGDSGRHLTASCGLAARRSGESAQQVLARADQAMCVAKEMSMASSPRRSVVCVDGVAPTALD